MDTPSTQKSVSAFSAASSELQTQNAHRPRPAPPTAYAADELLVQFSISLRNSLRKELARIVDAHDVTMRAFIMNASKENGLNVQEADLLDLRKERG